MIGDRSRRFKFRAALAAAFALVLAGTAEGGERLALVIGNAQYENTSPLANPVSDAKIIGAALTRAGFEVSELHDLGQRDMKRAVRDFADKVAAAGPDTAALFYYAGHGLQVDGVNYLIPTDAAIERESDVGIEAIGLTDVLSSIEFAGAGVNIVILDACNDNPLKRSFRSSSRGLARVDAPTGSIVAYATAPGQTAADGTGANSPYSAALAATLTTPGLPIEQVFKQVRVNVKAATGDKQVPWESSSLTSDFFFVEGVAPEPPAPVANLSPVPAAPVAPTPATPAPNDQLAEADYLAAVSADTIEAYRAFLEKYPTSRRAAQAQQIIGVKVEADAWRRAEESGSKGAYQQYLAAFPEGQHKAAAEQQIALLDTPTEPEPETPRTVPPPAESCGPAGPYRVVGIPGNDILSVRAGPGRDASEVGTIPPGGSGIAVGNCVVVQGYRQPWCEVRYQCLSGWAYARYLVDSSDVPPGTAVASAAPTARGPETFRVTGVESWDYLNLRAGPGTNYQIVIGIPPNGSGVTVGGCRDVQGYRNRWCEASWQGYQGWTSSCCLVGERSGRRLD
jgi:uncharacterized protein YraI